MRARGQTNAMTEFAVRYNDQSPLENHHVATAWTILRSSGCELFEPLSPEQRRGVRKLMIASILSTDMTLHFALKNELDGVVLRNTDAETGSVAAALESDLDRTVLIKVQTSRTPNRDPNRDPNHSPHQKRSRNTNRALEPQPLCMAPELGPNPAP